MSHVHNIYSAIQHLQCSIEMSATTSLVQSAVQIKIQRTHVQAQEGSHAEKGVGNCSVHSRNGDCGSMDCAASAVKFFKIYFDCS